VWLAKPRTYMNLSGSAVSSLSRWLDLDPARIMVVADDVDLPLGRLRLRRSGGPGTHNGLRDVVAAIGSGFPRLRLGVCGADPWDDLAEYVLSPFEADEEEAVEAMVTRAAEAVQAVIFGSVERAMNVFNRAPEE
jgi:PTH1 family peptidyl-tRNA hydrolase